MELIVLQNEPNTTLVMGVCSFSHSSRAARSWSRCARISSSSYSVIEFKNSRIVIRLGFGQASGSSLPRLPFARETSAIPESRVNATTFSNWLLIRNYTSPEGPIFNYRNTCIFIPGELLSLENYNALTNLCTP